MALIKLLLFDDDYEYCLNLCNYLTHNFKETLIVNSFSNTCSIQQWIEKIDPDIVLTSEVYYNQIQNYFKKNVIILTTGTNSVQYADQVTIYKYKDVNQIAAEIINTFTKEGNIIRTTKEKTLKIIAVYSAIGNVGKTTISLGVSKICSYSGLSVFYLNLEQFQSTNTLYPKNSEYSISDLIYYVKERDRNLSSKISSISCKTPITNLYYFNEPNNVFELDEITPQDIEFIITSIKDCGQYDLLVIDMESHLNRNSLKVFEIADEILYVFTEEEICLHKTKLFIDSISMLSNNMPNNTFIAHKLIYVANKVSKQALQSNQSFLDLKITSQIHFQQGFMSLSNLAKVNGGPEIYNSVFKELANRYIT